ncbi:hypothetical protein Tco_0810886 [Tanacetum coccineum]
MKSKLALLEASLLICQSSKTSQPKNKCLVSETYNWDEEDVTSDHEELVEVKVLMALSHDEKLAMGKNHDEWINITMRTINILLYMDDNGLGVQFPRAVGFLRGTSAVVVILVKGHAFPTIVKVPQPILIFQLDLTVLSCDPLALVDGFTPVEDNIGLLETRFDEEAIFVFVFPEDVACLVNLTLLSLFLGVTTTNLSLEIVDVRAESQLVPECA